MDKSPTYPQNFLEYQQLFPRLFELAEEYAREARTNGPLDEKTTHLIQLAAAIAVRSVGAVHSHVRRAMEAGARPEEIFHVVNLMVSTLGFPAAASAFSWVNDVLRKTERP